MKQGHFKLVGFVCVIKENCSRKLFGQFKGFLMSKEQTGEVAFGVFNCVVEFIMAAFIKKSFDGCTSFKLGGSQEVTMITDSVECDIRRKIGVLQ